MSLSIIVSDQVGCTQDLVHPFDNGLIYKEGDVHALAENLRQVFSDFERLTT